MFKFTKKNVLKKLFKILEKKNIYNCLDLFCGSGILGFNIIKKNNINVYFIDNNSYLIKNILEYKYKKNFQKIFIKNLNFMKNLKYFSKFFDLIFLDLPFKKSKDLIILINIIKNLLKLNSFLYIQSKLNYNFITSSFGENFYIKNYFNLNYINYYLFNFK